MKAMIRRKNYRACYYRSRQWTSADLIDSTEISQMFVFMLILHHLFHAEFLCFQCLYFLFVLQNQFLHRFSIFPKIRKM